MKCKSGLQIVKRTQLSRKHNSAVVVLRLVCTRLAKKEKHFGWKEKVDAASADKDNVLSAFEVQGSRILDTKLLVLSLYLRQQFLIEIMRE